MTACRRTLAISAAVCALAGAGPALAQPEDDYEFARPAPQDTVIYREAPIVQPLPGDAAPADDEVVGGAPLPPPPPLAYPAAPPAPMIHHGPAAGAHHAPVMHPPIMHPPVMHAPLGHGTMAHYLPPHGYAPPMPPRFDRDEWLADCRARIRGVDRKDRGGVIGGLLGGIAGGIVGNRVYDSERLAGTLIGAGVGGLAGIAIGVAIGAAGDRKREDECAWHLDRYMAGGYPGVAYGQGYPGYGYGYGYWGYTLVPVMVAVPQRAVVRETVTEEYEHVPVRARSVPRTKVIPQSAPAPDKRMRYIKGK